MKELESQGYQLVRNVLSFEDTASLRDAITDTLDRVAGAFRTPFSTSCAGAALEERIDLIARQDPAYAVALFHAVMADAQRDPRMEALSDHPCLVPIIADLLSPLTRIGQVIRTRAVVSALSSARSSWHQDVIRKPGEGSGCGAVRLACWIPLTDVDEHSGALELIPGTWIEPLPHCADENNFFIQNEQLPASERLVVPLRRGDVLILDRFIPHRSLPVQQGWARWAVVMWVKAGSTNEQLC